MVQLNVEKYVAKLMQMDSQSNKMWAFVSEAALAGSPQI